MHDYSVPPVTIPNGSSAAVTVQLGNTRGKGVTEIIMVAGACVNVVTFTYEIKDAAGIVRGSIAGLAKAATHVKLPADLKTGATMINVPPNAQVTITPSGDPGSAWVIASKLAVNESI